MVDFPKTLFNASELMTISSGFRNAVSGITEETIQRLTALIVADEADLNKAINGAPILHNHHTIIALPLNYLFQRYTSFNLPLRCAVQYQNESI